MKKKKKHINADILEDLGAVPVAEDSAYNPDKLSEKIGNFCEHVVVGLIFGLRTGAGLGFCWLLAQATSGI